MQNMFQFLSYFGYLYYKQGSCSNDAAIIAIKKYLHKKVDQYQYCVGWMLLFAVYRYKLFNWFT